MWHISYKKGPLTCVMGSVPFFFVCLKKFSLLTITMGSHTLFKKRKNMVHTRKTATKLHAFLSSFKRRMIDKKSHRSTLNFLISFLAIKILSTEIILIIQSLILYIVIQVFIERRWIYREREIWGWWDENKHSLKNKEIGNL